MAIGDKIQNKFTSYTDSYTGVTVTRLTDPNHTSHHMYFYNKMTTNDGKYLLYCPELNGERQLYLMNLQDGEAVQLTEGEGIDDYGGMISSDDKFLFYQQGNSFFKMDLNTYERECFYTTPEGWKGSSPGMSDDNHYMTIVETKIDTIAATVGGKNWDFFAQNCLAKPLCRIVYIDVIKKQSHVVLQDRCWFGHTQIRPQDPDTILFCHEGPYDLIDARLWLVQSDGSNYRCCREQANDLILTHEFWLPDGSKLAFVYRETTGDKIENIRMIDPITLEEEILMPCSPFAHFICDKKNVYMVGDAQGSDVPIHLLDDASEPDHSGEVKNDFIYLIDVAKRKEMRLCYHGTSWRAKHGNPQDAHPHPFFTEDNKSIIFVSDREGKPCIYKVDLEGVELSDEKQAKEVQI